MRWVGRLGGVKKWGCFWAAGCYVGNVEDKRV